MTNATSTTVKTILIADDDADDRLFMIEALRHNGFRHEVKFVEDGEDLMNYLTHQNGFNAENAPLPSLILLDLNMPRKNGFQALAEIRSNMGLRRLPVVVMSTSTANGDVVKTYEIGVNSYIVKPHNFNRLVEVVNSLKYYWLETVQLPV
ncbi:response regulator [Fibrella forsythiae]|uniref:Response regulator n=1 Tax=Fibrella forsythiae TaxID=2817061 RepID=A0ABS3JQ07_9BACT|nr:response regulator [Fibrella forsythiae]MBO0952084.1 response regulator [Fibrella forsythiae]